MTFLPNEMRKFFLIILTFISFSYANCQNTDNWLGNYKFEEQPVSNLDGTLYLVMIWDLNIFKAENNYYAQIEINGEQTMMTLKAKVKCSKENAVFYFDKGISGFGYDYLKKGDNLFEIKMVKGQMITHWNILEPRLAEKYKNDIVCFVKKN